MKKVYIVRGIPGSFKSTLSAKLSEENYGVIFSTDNFWMIDGEYKFEPSLIGDAHKWNQLCFLKAARSGYPVLIVDNTNTTWREIEFYADTAIKYGYDINVLEPDNPDRFNAQKSFERNTHNVPLEVIKKMIERWEPTEEILKKIKELKNDVH